MLLIKKYKGIRKEYILNLFENLNDRINKTLENMKSKIENFKIDKLCKKIDKLDLE